MYKGQQVEQNFPELGSGSYMKLDMRFADEEDAGDIACVIEISSACEYDESSPFYYRKKSMASASSAANAASFFSSSSTVSKQEIEDQTHSSNTRWIVLETALPEEQVVCAARLIMVDRTEGASERRAVVDVLASMPDTQQSSVRAQMLVALERIAMGNSTTKLVIEVSQHRTDLQEWLEGCGYEELGGRQCTDENVIKPTMVFEFHKDLTKSALAPNIRDKDASTAGSASVSVSTSTAVPASVSVDKSSDSKESNPKPIASINAGGVGVGVTLELDIDADDVFDFSSLSMADVEVHGGGAVGGGVGELGGGGEGGGEGQMKGLIGDLFKALHKEM